MQMISIVLWCIDGCKINDFMYVIYMMYGMCSMRFVSDVFFA